MNVKILIDGDPFAYRAAFSCEDKGLADAKDKLDDLLDEAIQAVLWSYTDEDYQVFLTGKGNFRNDIAVTHKYKDNRKDFEKPEHLEPLRKYMVKEWKAIVSKGEEADDLIGIWSTDLKGEAIIVSVDKDMLQLPATHYNPVKKTFTEVTEFDGLKFFYSQILTGDVADNIKGLKGIGPVKAGKLLESCTTEQDLYEACLAAYAGDEDRVLENGRLLWLRRHEGQLWEAPKCTDQG